MSIRLIAKDLYQLQREVERLEKELRASLPEQRADLEEHLRKTKAERDRMRSLLEANKEPPPYRKPR